MPIKYVIHTLNPEPAIKEFFSNNSTTDQAACDALARQITGAEVSPVIDQGTCSYTVEAKTEPPIIVQFRAGFTGFKKINLDLYQWARQVYGDVVPKCNHHGEIGNLQVYTFDRVPGMTVPEHMMTTNLSDEEEKAWRTRLAESLAEFFAKAWNAPINVSPEQLAHMHQQAKSSLDTIAPFLPPRYTPLLQKLKSAKLFDGAHPIVPTHNDFGILNFFVDSSSGRLTGVVDWADAILGPFGYPLHGFEDSCLGWMGPREWTYYAWHAEVRDAFWARFEQLTGVCVGSEAYEKIMTARHVGHLLRHGFHWSDEENKEVCEPRMEYLDALLADGLTAETDAKE